MPCKEKKQEKCKQTKKEKKTRKKKKKKERKKKVQLMYSFWRTYVQLHSPLDVYIVSFFLSFIPDLNLREPPPYLLGVSDLIQI